MCVHMLGMLEYGSQNGYSNEASAYELIYNTKQVSMTSKWLPSLILSVGA